MGNNNTSSSFHQMIKCILYLPLCLSIESARCFIEDEYLRIRENCSSDSKSLSLSTRELESTLPYYRIESIWKSQEKFIKMCLLTCTYNIFFRNIITNIGEIMSNAIIKKGSVLKDNSKERSIVLKRIIRDLVIIEPNRSI